MLTKVYKQFRWRFCASVRFGLRRVLRFSLCVFAFLPQAAFVSHADAAFSASVISDSALSDLVEQDLETLVVKSMREVAENRFSDALATIDHALEINPNFKLAHAVRGDILMARARPITGIGGGSGAPPGTIADFEDEARVRVRRLKEAVPQGRMPRSLIQFDSRQKYGVAVDVSRSRLYLFENVDGEARYVADYYVSTGKAGSMKMREGDQKTPVGVYFVTSFLPDRDLDDFYGAGAYPISYPNEWDKRQGKNGYGIWLHGVPKDTYSRPPRSSNGCVALTNSDFLALGNYVESGLTPVVIGDELDWVDRELVMRRRQELNEALERWRSDWQSLNTEAYLGHYSREFVSSGQDIRSWSAHKMSVNASKAWVTVHLSNISMFSQPDNEDLVVVTYDQDYKSSNHVSRMKKRQYWRREEGGWRVVYEGAA